MMEGNTKPGERCFLQDIYNCALKKDNLSNITRIEKIISSSKTYGDNIHVSLQEQFDSDKNLTLRVHRSCVDNYTHPKTLSRAIAKRKTVSTQQNEPAKKVRRSDSHQFNFREHCIFCAQNCNVCQDQRHPDRWRPAYMCTEYQGNDGNDTFKHSILETCDKRGDEWAEQVRVRISGAPFDLHAADARYHIDCRANFMSPRSVNYAANADRTDKDTDAGFQSVVKEISGNQSRIWNSIELYNLYTEGGGNELSRRSLISKLSDYYGTDIVTLSSPGTATLVAFKSTAAQLLKIIPDMGDDDTEQAIHRVKTKICKETKAIPIDRKNYDIRIDNDAASKAISKTLLDLLAKISPKLDHTLPALMIGSIISSTLQNYPTSLQLCMAILLRDSKETITTLNRYQVCCTHDELLRFKKSAACAATLSASLTGISDSSEGLIQFVVDNFDADISSRNGKLSTHSLAMLMTQPKCTTHEEPKTIPRIDKTAMKDPIQYEADVVRYDGPEKPDMPPSAALKQVLPLRLLAQMKLSTSKARETDAAFIRDIISKPNTPEFNGYNTALARDQKLDSQPQTKAAYLPLIDMPPANHDTILTAMVKAQTMTKQTGQKFTLFTADLQLYKLVVDIKWAYPDKFSTLFPRLGGMHMLMSFIGSIGSIMEETGLSEVLSSVFGGVPKMLIGKKFPQNMRALRLLTEELLRPIIEKHEIENMDQLMAILDDLASQSRTTRVWVNVVIKSTFIMMMYVRGEREGNVALNVVSTDLMLPYFYFAMHLHYARYGLYFKRSFEALPEDIMNQFLNGFHVMRHIDGIWNAIWSDMFIESMFMRYGHGKSGIIGITLQPETLKTWALSRHICAGLVNDIKKMCDGDRKSVQNSHKEEAAARIASDAKDRQGLKEKLATCIDPLSPQDHPDNIVNIVTGKIAPPEVNIDQAVEIGTQMMKEFEDKWPTGFHEPIKKKMVSMSVTKKTVQVGSSKVYDTNLIYARVLGLQASGREVNIQNVLSHELSPVPSSLFNDAGEMRICKSKADLKNKTKVEVSARGKGTEHTPYVVLDGCALLWIPKWPASGVTQQATVDDFVNKFQNQIGSRLKESDVYLIFDRYLDYSSKCSTRSARASDVSRVYKLSPTTPLPPQKCTLNVTENKKQLINIIVEKLQSDQVFISRYITDHKLVITGQSGMPIEISHGGVTIQRHDIATTHEEADNIIVQQVMMLAENDKPITVVADDTDVYAQLLSFCLARQVKSPIFMESPIKDRTVIDIQRSVTKNRKIIPDLMAAHALTGCDTVASSHGIAKGTMLNILKKDMYPLTLLGNLNANWDDILKQSMRFTAACYGYPDYESLSDLRYKVWITKTGNRTTTAPKLCDLPPTNSAFEQNVKRAHMQTSIWKAALMPNPPDLEVEQYGWIKDKTMKTLMPVTVPQEVPLAPDYILQLIRCSCSSETPCGSVRCSCKKAGLPCTAFCKCGSNCRNEESNLNTESDDESEME